MTEATTLKIIPGEIYLRLPDPQFDPRRNIWINGFEFCPVASNTQTTQPDQQDAAESVTLWAEVNALGGVGGSDWDHGHAVAISTVLEILERRGFTEASDANRREQPSQRNLKAEGNNPPQTGGDASSGDILPSRLDDMMRKPDAWVANYMVLPDERTPEDQRTMFEQLIAEGRPTTVEVKVILDQLHAAFEPLDHYDGAVSAMTNRAAAIIDRLGCALIAQDAELAEARGQLERIAANAKPVDNMDVAELVQKARDVASYIGRSGMWHGSSGSMHGKSIVGPDTARLIDNLIAALNDQVRKTREAEAKVWRFDVTKVADVRQNALLAMDVLDRFADDQGPFTRRDAARMVGTIRTLLHHAEDMEVHRDAARDHLSDVERERDELQRDFDRERANYASTAATLAWVHSAADSDLIPKHIAEWGAPIGQIAEEWVKHLRAQVEALRADLHRVQANTAQYRQESRGREEQANRRAADCEERCNRLREAVPAALAAIERGDARTYTEEQRKKAANAATLQYCRASWDGDKVAQVVAEALGMRRA